MWKPKVSDGLRQTSGRLVHIVQRLAHDEELRIHARGALDAVAGAKPSLLGLKERVIAAVRDSEPDSKRHDEFPAEAIVAHEPKDRTAASGEMLDSKAGRITSS